MSAVRTNKHGQETALYQKGQKAGGSLEAHLNKE